MKRSTVPAFLLVSALVLPASATTSEQHQFSCLSRQAIVDEVRIQMFDCLGDDGYEGRNGIVDHVVVEDEKTKKLYYNTLDGANQKTSAMFEDPKKVLPLTSRLLRVFQTMFDALIVLEEETAGE